MFGAKKTPVAGPLKAAPLERAREAFRSGRPVFQVQVPIATHAIKIGAVGTGAYGVDHREHDVDELLSGIENEGWMLAHAGFVYEPVETSERGKLSDAHGHVGSVGGRTIGIYVFRRALAKPRSIVKG